MKWKDYVLPVLAMLGIMACSAARAEDVLVGNLDQGVPPAAGGPLYDVILSPVAGDPLSGFTAAQEFTPGLAGETLTRVFPAWGGTTWATAPSRSPRSSSPTILPPTCPQGTALDHVHAQPRDDSATSSRRRPADFRQRRA